MNGTFIANQLVSSVSDAIRTIITFDNGAEWHLLQAPEVTADGSETDCEVVSRWCCCSVCVASYFYSLFAPYTFTCTQLISVV